MEYARSLAEHSVQECSNLTNITIPNSVKSIGESAFEECTSLQYIYYTGTNSQWNNIRKSYDWNENIPSDCQIIYNYSVEN